MPHFQTTSPAPNDQRPDLCRAAAANDAALSFACHSRLEDIKTLAERWRDLEGRSLGEMAYFQSYDWCQRWCKTFTGEANGAHSPIRIFTASRAGELAILLPMVIEDTVLGIRKLHVIGRPLTQYSSALIDPMRASREDVAAFWQWVKAAADCDVIVMDGLPERTRLAEGIADVDTLEEAGQAAVMDVSQLTSPDELTMNVKSSTRRRRNRRRNKLAKGGTLEVLELDGSDARYAHYVAVAFEWKQRWLSETGRYSDALFDERAETFLSKLKDGTVLLVLLRDDEPVAIEIGYVLGDHYYSYLGAFNYELRHLSPGKVHLEEALAWTVRRKLAYFDLLGDPSTYKESWSNTNIRLFAVVSAKSWKGFLFAHVWQRRMRPAIKSAFYALPEAFRRPFATGRASASALALGLMVLSYES